MNLEASLKEEGGDHQVSPSVRDRWEGATPRGLPEGKGWYLSAGWDKSKLHKAEVSWFHFSGSADCKDPRMKTTRPCVSSGNWRSRGRGFPGTRALLTAGLSVPWAGSLWDPNITLETLDAYQLRVSFTLWSGPTHYQVLLNSFPRTENERCFTHTLDIPAVTARSPSRLRALPKPRCPLTGLPAACARAVLGRAHQASWLSTLLSICR